LPSSLTGVLSRTLGFSPRLPVSVCGTDTKETHIEVFLGSMIRASWLARRLVSPSLLGVKTARIFLGDPPTSLDPHFQSRAGLSLLRHPIVQTSQRWYRNFNLFAIAYAFRPRLRIRLTLGGRTFPRKQPRSPAKAPKYELSDKGCGSAQTARMLA